MKISIVTVCRNAASTIGACLQSVAAQTYGAIEHVVIDGASTDSTLATVRKFPHVRQVVSEPDRGVYDAMNKGLSLCTGDLVLFLNADDRLFAPSTIADAVAAIAAQPGAGVYYGWLEVRPVFGDPVIFQPPPPQDVPDFMVTGCLPHQSTLARRTVFDRTGPFDLNYPLHAEYDWYLKALADPEVRFAALPLVIGSFAEGGLSSQLELGQPEIYDIQGKAELYAGSSWGPRRIELLQRELLAHRLEGVRLKERIADLERNLSEARMERSRSLWTRLTGGAQPVRVLAGLSLGEPVHCFEDRSRHYLLSGWSSRESWGTWSEGPRSLLGFITPTTAPARLRCRVTAFLAGNGRQGVAVRVNGRRVAKWSFSIEEGGTSPSDRLIDLPPAPDGRYEIAFRYSDPTSPASLGGADARELALGLVELELEAAG